MLLLWSSRPTIHSQFTPPQSPSMDARSQESRRPGKMSFTAKYRSIDGIEEYEKDDIETCIAKLETVTGSVDRKEKQGRSTTKERRELESQKDELGDLIRDWAQRPRPSTTTGDRRQIVGGDDKCRQAIRRLYAAIDSICAGDKAPINLDEPLEELLSTLRIDDVDSVKFKNRLDSQCEQQGKQVVQEEIAAQWYDYGNIDWDGPELADVMEYEASGGVDGVGGSERENMGILDLDAL